MANDLAIHELFMTEEGIVQFLSRLFQHLLWMLINLKVGMIDCFV